MSHGETVLVTLGLDSVDLDGLHRCKMDKEVYTYKWGGECGMEKDGLHLVTCCTRRVTKDYDREKWCQLCTHD